MTPSTGIRALDEQSMVAAFDPGAATGFAVAGSDGIVFSDQGTPECVLQEWLPWVKATQKSRNLAGVVVESTFVGAGAHASLHVTEAAGFVCGALWAAGIRVPIWRWNAGSWRSRCGMKVTTRNPKTNKSRRLKGNELIDHEVEFIREVTGRTYARSDQHRVEAMMMALAGWAEYIRAAA